MPEPMSEPMPEQHLVIVLKNLGGGGIERRTLQLIQAFQQKPLPCQITLVLFQAIGECLPEVPDNITIVDLGLPYDARLTYLCSKLLPALTQALRKLKPDVILSRLPCFNCLTVLAHRLAGCRARLVLSEHTLPFHRLLAIEKGYAPDQPLPGLLPKIVLPLMKWTYPQADAIVAVSQGIAAELRQSLNLTQRHLRLIYNPVVDDKLMAQAQATIDHPWFQNADIPVFLAVGRLTTQKDYPTLLRAFASVVKTHPARLVILGEGELRSPLSTLIQQLSLQDVVDMPGFTANPYAYMTRSHALVLSSVWETFGTVLVEALACGCPVIATDCNYGPREILLDGEYGTLVPVQDSHALAAAMVQAIANPLHSGSEAQPEPQRLQAYAHTFSVTASADCYAKTLGLLAEHEDKGIK
ncbi:MAG: glycosyltransferase [Leptolyngbyaceae bacterium]|nr:glycosyltransferase [Leptolyngbyaceae bacterium]